MRPKERRKMAKYARKQYSISSSRACRILGLPRSTFDYEEHPRDDSEVVSALKELAGQNKRFGHPRLFLLLSREKDIRVNHKRSERIYQELGLQIKKRSGTSREVPFQCTWNSGQLALDLYGPSSSK